MYEFILVCRGNESVSLTLLAIRRQGVASYIPAKAHTDFYMRKSLESFLKTLSSNQASRSFDELTIKPIKNEDFALFSSEDRFLPISARDAKYSWNNCHRV
jgi:hypothetical protein